MTPFLSLLSQNFAPVLLALVVTFLAPIGFFFAVAHTIAALARDACAGAIDERSRAAAVRAGRASRANPSSPSARRSAAKCRRWAMASSARLRAPPNWKSLVQNEVSALERAYNDNEVRIRSLLDDLAVAARQPDRPGRTGAQRHHRRASRSQSGHHRHQRPGRPAGRDRDRRHHPRSDGKERSHQRDAQSRQRRDAGAARRARRRNHRDLQRLPETAAPRRKPRRRSRPSVRTPRLRSSNPALPPPAPSTPPPSGSMPASSFKTEHIAEEFDVLSQNLMEMMQLRLSNVTNDFSQRSSHHHRADERARAGSHRRSAAGLGARPPKRSRCAARRSIRR